MWQTPQTDQQHRAMLQSIAHRAMLERGLLPDFSAAALAELDRIQAPAGVNSASGGDPLGIRDLTDLLWTSIDNDDSRDLDRITCAEEMPEDKVKIRVAVADVDALVKNVSAIDEHARHDTTSVYTAAEIFPMLPEKLSTDRTSVYPQQLTGFWPPRAMGAARIVVDVPLSCSPACQPPMRLLVGLPEPSHRLLAR